MIRALAAALRCLALLMLAPRFALAEPALVIPANRATPAADVLLVEVHVNGAPVSGLAVFRSLPDGCDSIEAPVLREAGLYYGTDTEVCLRTIPGVDYNLDRAGARLEIYAAHLAPEETGLAAPRRNYAPQLSGVIGQYGLSAQAVDTGAGVERTAFADVSLTAHTPWGRLQNDQVAVWNGRDTQVQRLATVYERDFPDNMARLTLGDSFTRAPRWGRLSAFAGLQYGTDLSMDPEQSYRPFRTFTVLLREQSEIDVRVNGTVRQRESLTPGFNTFGVVPEAGLNDVEIAIRGANGLTQIEEASFFAPADGLAKGVTDYSVSIGVPRRFVGLTSDYRDTLLASGLVRRGLSDAVTAEAHGEFGADVHVLGTGLQVTAGTMGILNVAASISEVHSGGRGHLLSAGVDRNTRRASLQLQARVADTEYADAASASGAGFPDVSLRASAGVFTPAGSFRATYTEQSDRELADRRFVSAGWEKTFDGNRAILSASGFHDFERGESGCTISLRISFGQDAVRAGHETFGGRGATSLELSHTREAGQRLQWSARAVTGEAGDGAQADLQVDLGSAEAFLHAGRTGRISDAAAGVRGAFTWLPGRVVLTRQTTLATALVEVPGLAGLPIYQDNRRVAVTDESGWATIPGVRPFEVNRLSLRPDDVPLDHELAQFDLEFIPQRGIAHVAFDAQRDTSLAFSVRLSDGSMLSAGSRVVLKGSGLICPAGLDGRVFCAAVTAGETVVIETAEGRFDVAADSLRKSGHVDLPAASARRYAGEP